MTTVSTAAASALFAVVGKVADLGPAARATLLDRGRATDEQVEAAVREVIRDVRERGDAALHDLAHRFDGVTLGALEVPRAAWDLALQDIPASTRAALEQAARAIEAFHRAQLPAPLEIENTPGVRLGRRADPLARVGVYAPGGRAAYPSSVLMGAVPARVAGVAEVIVCSPPGPDGLPPREVLAACALAGADRVFAIGGAGAVAALALGTDSVPRVDKIVGPGNAYVTEAKRQLNGTVAIDSPAGPSEVLVIGDGSADPALVAAELLAQAEHDPDASAVLVSTSHAECDAVMHAVQQMLESQPRAEIIRASLLARGAVLLAEDTAQALEFATLYAPEHLAIMTAEPRALLPEVRGAGTVFLGAWSSVAFGDYITGANHVLPTAGLARAWSGLSTLDFLRWTTYQELSPAAAAALSAPTVTLAEAEGLPAHALAAQLRGDAALQGSRPDADPAVHATSVDATSADGTATAAGTPVQLRPAYAHIEPYDPGRLPCDTDLSDNTSLWGAPPSVQPLLRDAPAARFTRYPSVYAPDVKRALARLLEVEPENITTGCGSDDVIDSAIRAFCEAGDTVAYPDPTFGMVPVFGRMNATLPLAIPLGADFALDAEPLLAQRARLTYICRPNNPTGTAFDRDATERVCRHAAGVVLIDEAYAEFADDNMLDVAIASDRTVILRTMSKAWGLAGLRIGYAVGPAELIREIEKSRGPYKLSGVAEAAAERVLSVDQLWVRERVEEVQVNRSRLTAALADRGVRCWPSAANFVLAAVPGSAASWNGQLRARQVAVRPFPQLRHAGECVRISIGPWSMMERFLSAFDHVMETTRDSWT